MRVGVAPLFRSVTPPITVAKGVPGTLGMLPRAEDCLRSTTGRTGVVMADFPCAGLVQAVIARNFS